jgi:hypothetical protein
LPTVKPSFFSAMNRLMPLWRGSAAGSVFTSSATHVAVSMPLEIQVLVPLMT